MSKPFFSIVTPTLERPSLVRCCESVNTQSYASWEHIVAVDAEFVNEDLHSRIDHPQRYVFACGQRFGHFGNHARWLAWEHARGRYLVMLDDDNYLYHPDALSDIADCLASDSYPDWAIFPIHRHGSVFLLLPPGMCMTDTMNVVVKRELGRWPDIEAREADGVWTEELKKRYAYSAFPDVRPIGMMERSSNGI